MPLMLMLNWGLTMTEPQGFDDWFGTDEWRGSNSADRDFCEGVDALIPTMNKTASDLHELSEMHETITNHLILLALLDEINKRLP